MPLIGSGYSWDSPRHRRTLLEYGAILQRIFTYYMHSYWQERVYQEQVNNYGRHRGLLHYWGWKYCYQGDIFIIHRCWKSSKNNQKTSLNEYKILVSSWNLSSRTKRPVPWFLKSVAEKQVEFVQ